MNRLHSLTLSMFLVLCACSANQSYHSNTDSSDPSIVGGEAVAFSEEIAKSTVGLAMLGQGVVCTGTLVAPNLVLTAAHCVSGLRPSLLRIVFGLDLESESLEVRRVLGGRVTERWVALADDEEFNWGDVALLRFESSAPAGYQPVRLLGSMENLKDQADIELAGYGLTSMAPMEDPKKLLKADVKLTNSHYSETEFLVDFQHGQGVCHGDSGGPIYTKINDKLFVIGVTSRSETLQGGQTCLEGAVFTSVPGSIEFLKESAKSLNSKDFVPMEPIPGHP
ncbi:MAG: trypsin-like serine protease [Pseudobdellovibrionaceae bacterium]